MRQTLLTPSPGALGPGAAQRPYIQATLGGQTAGLGGGGGEARGRFPRGRAIAGGRRAAAVNMRENVGLLDLAAGRHHLGEVDAVLLGQLARQRRGLHHARRRRVPFSRSRDERDGLTHGHHVPFPCGHAAQDAAGGGLDLHRDLVGLDLHDGLAFSHRVAGRLEPANDLAGLLRQLQGRHDDRGRHQVFPQSALAAANTVCSDGTVRSSSTGEKGTGTSMAPRRFTGASR